jgi:hypothetical protein
MFQFVETCLHGREVRLSDVEVVDFDASSLSCVSQGDKFPDGGLWHLYATFRYCRHKSC